MRRQTTVYLLAAFTVITSASGRSPVLSSPEWTEARKVYFEGVEGNRQSAEKAVKLVAALYESHPEDTTVKAYRGSLYLLESSWALAPWKKGSLAKSGLGLLDEAIKSSPEDLEIRFVRAASTMRLPGFFRREAQSADDFALLAAKAPPAVSAGVLEPKLAAAALLYHGLNCQKRQDAQSARRAWQIAVSIGRETPPAREASRLLQGEKL